MNRSEGIVFAMKQIAEGSSLGDVLITLREEGLTKNDSSFIMKHAIPTTLSEAQLIVHLSEAWADRREYDEQFHERMVGLMNDPRIADYNENGG